MLLLVAPIVEQVKSEMRTLAGVPSFRCKLIIGYQRGSQRLRRRDPIRRTDRAHHVQRRGRIGRPDADFTGAINR